MFCAREAQLLFCQAQREIIRIYCDIITLLTETDHSTWQDCM